MRDFLKEEKTLCAEVENLCMQNPQDAYEMIVSLLYQCDPEQKSSRAQSAALSRICCRFLLHRKSKSIMLKSLTQSDEITKPLFGELNTYKYSLVFLLKRLIRLNDLSLTKKLFDFLSSNPYRDDSSKDYSDRWSMNFLIDEAMSAPDDYLNLTEENKKLIESYRV